MKQKFHYATVTEAINKLKEQGFNLDFNLSENQLKVGQLAYPASDFDIVDQYRYEGPSDPADEATVYALASPAGQKGILVTGYGYSTDKESEDTLKQLHYKYLAKDDQAE
ncbi:hypothetical protein [Mucilaginibacter glaciei]|uniref:Phosphoribosylpyrophosphate synthetase n=1 Tax=Mucilaginibacter glaciei TaxID=2772109 RepID=A0A926NPV1_9SPHI|nr:hypothetical protein [Mucilaginibacter glaciei]MBD1391695.1 hypothetical protein [Mucilaginibacter glaciei]